MIFTELPYEFEMMQIPHAAIPLLISKNPSKNHKKQKKKTVEVFKRNL